MSAKPIELHQHKYLRPKRPVPSDFRSWATQESRSKLGERFHAGPKTIGMWAKVEGIPLLQNCVYCGPVDESNFQGLRTTRCNANHIEVTKVAHRDSQATVFLAYLLRRHPVRKIAREYNITSAVAAAFARDYGIPTIAAKAEKVEPEALPFSVSPDFDGLATGDLNHKDWGFYAQTAG